MRNLYEIVKEKVMYLYMKVVEAVKALVGKVRDLLNI